MKAWTVKAYCEELANAFCETKGIADDASVTALTRRIRKALNEWLKESTSVGKNPND